MENATQQQEQADFYPSYDNISRSNAIIYDHTDNGSSTYSLMLDGQPNRIIGLAKSLQVLPGDTVSMEVYGKYLAATSNNNNVAGGIATAITGAFGLTATVTGELLSAYNSLNGLFGAGPLIGAGDWEDDNAPKAFLNYILFDKNFVAYEMGFDQIDINALENGSDIAHDRMALTTAVKRPGYIYIYLSNENSKQVEVYFPARRSAVPTRTDGDDLSITHHHTPVIQTDDYYPFGLTIAGLSGRTENKVENKFLYQGKEIQSDLGLDTYDFEARMYDPVLGRTFQLDPRLENYHEWSPYSWTGDNPILMIDPTGMDWYIHSETGKLHWYNGTYEEEKTPEGYVRLGGDDFFGEKAIESLQMTKQKYKRENDGEELNYMTWNEEHSALIAEQFGFEKVPSKQFKYKSESNFIVGKSIITKSKEVSINEEFTYAAKGLDPSSKPIWNDITSYAGGFYNSMVEIVEISYSDRKLSKNVSKAVKFVSWAMKIYKGGDASNGQMNKKTPYKSWSEYPRGGPLDVYRPGGEFRKKLKL